MIVHIGFPKCASTSIQQQFVHSNAVFLGCKPKNPPGEFYDSNIGSFFEGIFRFGTDRQFKEKAPEIRDYLAKQNRIYSNRLVLSNENICFRLTPWDLPTDIKLHRLGQLLPSGTTILVCYREIRAFLVSLYKNHVSFGYTESFEHFLIELITLKDYGWFLDLDLGFLCELLEENLQKNGENPVR